MSDGIKIDELAKAAVKKLQALAQAATQGEWTAEAWTKIITDSIRVDTEKNFSIGGVLALLDGKEQISRDAAYIAAANPTAILAILSRVEALEGALKPFIRFAESLQEWRYSNDSWPTQPAWPEHKPILRRTWPADEETENFAELFKSDFDKIRALSTPKPDGGK